MAGLANGITIVSSAKDSKVSVDVTGTSGKIGGLTDNVTLVVPTGSAGVSGTKVDLPSPSASGGKTSTVNLNIGGHELTVQSSQPNTTMTFQVVNIGGVQTPVLAVTGKAQVSSSGDDKPIVSVAGNVIKSGKGSNSGGNRQVCNTVVQASSDASSDVVHVVTCYIVLEPGTFSAINGGRASNSFAAIKDGIVWAGETAEFDKNGIVTAAYLGTSDGHTTAVGDSYVNTSGTFNAASPLKVTAFIPRLAGTALRLNGARVDDSVFGVVNKYFNGTVPTPTQNSAGVYTFLLPDLKNGGLATVATQPSKRIKVDTSRADGIAVSVEGVVEVTTGGYIVSFIPSVIDPQAFASHVAQALPGAVSELRWNGTWQVTAGDGNRYVARPVWVQTATSAADGGFSNAPFGNISYNYQGKSQWLLPDFDDYDTLQATFRSALGDAGLTILPFFDGTATATVGGQPYKLYPQWNLTPAGNQPAWWVSNGIVYIKNGDGTAQGFTVK
jgi:hypothetical protein